MSHPPVWKSVRACRLGLTVLAASLVTAAGPAGAQPSLRNPSQPLLVYNAAGHTAPVRALAFVPGADGQLLSGGLDGVVNAWNVGGGRKDLARTIRPPLWRAPKGSVYAIAVTPEPVDGADRLLAVAGQSAAGGMNPILLYRFPGWKNLATGDPYKVLPSVVQNARGEDVPSPPVRGKAINSLSFNAKGTLLASGGHEKAVLVWSVPDEQVFCRVENADLTGHVNKVILSRDGTRLWTAGLDGFVHAWALRANAPARLLGYGVPLDSTGRQAADAANNEVVSLALSPDESTVIAGRESGTLIAYAAQTLGSPRHLLPEAQWLGPVDALAYHPSRPLVGLARINRAFRDEGEAPVTECVVETRSTADGRLTEPPSVVTDVVRSCAFSPDGGVLAYSGGDSQAIFLRDVPGKGAEVRELRGEGSSIRDLRFGRSGQVVAFRRGAGGPNAPATAFESFDLKARRVGTLEPAQVDATGWLTARPPYRLVALNRGTIRLEWGRGADDHRDLRVDTNVASRWYRYCLIPSPAGGWPSVAVGCENTVILFAPHAGPDRKIAYRETRHLRGHLGPVLALAVSPDGKWLASGGVDQTVRLWSLATASVVAPLGATLTPVAGGRLAVSGVDPDGFARRAGIKDGDLVVWAGFGRPSGATEFSAGKGDLHRPAARVQDAEPPGVSLQFEIERDGRRWTTETTKRDDPVVTLFLTDPRAGGAGRAPAARPSEHEWVLWNPDGFYDASVTADRRFLGWHRNAANAARSSADLYRPTSYAPIRAFENLLRRPDVVDRLLAGRPRSEALPKGPDGREPVDVVAAIDAETPPTIRLLEPAATDRGAVVVRDPELPIRVEVAGGAGDPSKVRSVKVFVDAQEVSTPEARGGGPAFAARVPLSRKGAHKVTVLATNRAGRERSSSFVVDYQPARSTGAPPGPVKAPELVVVSIGAERFTDEKFGVIRSATLDARGVAGEFFSSNVVQGYYPSYPPPVAGPASPVIRVSEGTTRREIERVFSAIRARGKEGALALPDWGANPSAAGRLGAHDTLVLVISSHVVDARAAGGTGEGGTARPVLVASDTRLDAAAETGVDLGPITETLGALVRQGCRVVTVLDGHHADARGAGEAVREWAYRLDQQDVIVCLASENAPSLPAAGDEFSPFFLALFSLSDPKNWRAEMSAGTRITLDLFTRLLYDRVGDVSKSQMAPYVNTPAKLDGTAPLFDPPAPPPAIARVVR